MRGAGREIFLSTSWKVVPVYTSHTICLWLCETHWDSECFYVKIMDVIGADELGILLHDMSLYGDRLRHLCTKICFVGEWWGLVIVCLGRSFFVDLYCFQHGDAAWTIELRANISRMIQFPSVGIFTLLFRQFFLLFILSCEDYLFHFKGYVL